MISVVPKNSNYNNNHSNFIQSTSGANALQVNNEEIKETENDLIILWLKRIWY